MFNLQCMVELQTAISQPVFTRVQHWPITMDFAASSVNLRNLSDTISASSRSTLIMGVAINDYSNHRHDQSSMYS